MVKSGVMTVKTVATNRKAFHNYLIDDKYEAGLVLTGSEIKSVRMGRISLGDAYVKPQDGELWLHNVHIARYEASSYMGHEPRRPRKLLLHKKEIKTLTAKIAEKGLTIVPTRLYIKGHVAKVEIALARGKRQYDKREAITRRDVERELARATKRR
jgi:SsrA-binding protein